MNNYLDLKNAEGYHDPVPYQASHSMIKPGEIWTKIDKSGRELRYLVIASGDDIVTGISLIDQYRDGCLAVDNNESEWLNPRMIVWAWGSQFQRRIRTLSVQDFDWILAEVENVLSIYIAKDRQADIAYGDVPSAETEEMREELRLTRDSLNAALAEYTALKTSSESEITTLRIQLEAIKGMYSDLLEKFVQRG